MDTIPMGSKVKDRITGVKGIVTARTEFITGCIRYNVEQPVNKDGTVPEILSFDEERLDIVEPPVEVKGTSGGPHPVVKQR